MKKPLVLILLMAGVVLSVFGSVVRGERVSAETTLLTHTSASSEQAVVNCRFGMAVEKPDAFPTTTQEIEWLPTFGSGWYIDFLANKPSLADQVSAEHVKVLFVSQHRNHSGERVDSYGVFPKFNDLTTLIQESPGALWLVGNEVDRAEVQGDIMPQLYARAYHDVYYHIKSIDPTAQVANSALVQITPGRLQYLDLMWDTYVELYDEPMPVDVWNAHVYILPERRTDGSPNNISSIALGTDLNLGIFESGGQASAACTNHFDNTYCFSEHDEMTIFRKHVRDMRRWMKDHGQQDKPLIVTEYGILLPFHGDNGCKEDENGQCFDQQRVSTYLHDTMDWYESARDTNLGFAGDDYKLVQQWLWFSAFSDRVGHASNVLKSNYPNNPAGSSASLTDVGRAYIQEVAESPLLTDLVIERTYVEHGDNVVRVGADIRNAGNVPLQSPVTVSFYSNPAQTNLIGQVTLSPELEGCGLEKTMVSTTWTPPRDGYNQFWVKVDSNNAVSEINEGNNSEMGRVIKNATQVWIPIVEN